MARGGGWAQAAADGIMGYLKGMQMQEGMDRDKEERDARAEERAYLREQRAEAKDEKLQMKAAAAPVEVQEGAGGYTKPETADNRDVGQPGDVGVAQGGLTAGVRAGGKAYATRAEGDTAAAAANTPDAVAARQAGVLRKFGKPLEATQLETAATQGKVAKLTLEKGEHDFVNQKLDERLAQVGNADELAQHASTLTGKQVSVVLGEDGKKAQLVYTNDKGEQVKYGKEFANTAEGVSREAINYAKGMKPSERVSALMHFATFDEQKRHNTATEAQATAQLAATERHYRATEGIAGEQLKLSKDEAGEKKRVRDADLMNRLPPVTKLEVQGLDRSIAGIEKTINDAEARGDGDPAGLSKLKVRLTQALERRDEILKQHAPKDAGGAGGGAPAPAGKGDYMGYNAPAAAKPGAATVAASTAPRVTTSATQQPSAVAAARQQAPAAGAAPLTQPEVAGQRLDAARNEAAAAQQELSTWGIVRRNQDPAGYQAALQRLQVAKQARVQAEADYQDHVGAVGQQPAFRTAPAL